jgi:hypothetical protein
MTTRNTAHHTATGGPGVRTVGDDELRTVRGGKSIWGHIKAGARWVKDHVVITLHSIGFKTKF